MVLHVSLYYDDLHSFGKWSFQSWSKALLWGAIFDQAGCLSTLLPCAMERTQRPKVESTMPGSSWLPCGCLAVIGIGWEQGRQFQVLLIWHGVSAGTDISWGAIQCAGNRKSDISGDGEDGSSSQSQAFWSISQARLCLPRAFPLLASKCQITFELLSCI